MDDKKQIVFFIERLAYKLRYRRVEGFADKSVSSTKLIERIKFLFDKLDKNTQEQILEKKWLDE